MGNTPPAPKPENAQVAGVAGHNYHVNDAHETVPCGRRTKPMNRLAVGRCGGAQKGLGFESIPKVLRVESVWLRRGSAARHRPRALLVWLVFGQYQESPVGTGVGSFRRKHRRLRREATGCFEIREKEGVHEDSGVS